MSHKGFVPILIILILAGAIALAGGAYYLGRSTGKAIILKPGNNSIITFQPEPSSIPTKNSEITITPSPIPDETADWESFKDTDYGYYFKYPKNFWITSTTVEKGPVNGIYSVEHGDSPPSPQGTVATFSVENLTNREEKDFSAWVDKFLQRQQVKVVIKENRIILNSPAYLVEVEIESGNTTYFYFLLKRDDSHYVSINISSSTLPKSNLKTLFEKILSTITYL